MCGQKYRDLEVHRVNVWMLWLACKAQPPSVLLTSGKCVGRNSARPESELDKCVVPDASVRTRNASVGTEIISAECV
jgi:hypothetical protein